MQKIVVSCYSNPDVDGFACVLAYAEFLNKIGQVAEFFIFGELHEEAKWLVKRFNISWAGKMAQKFNEAADVILVDCSWLQGLDKSIKPEKVIEVIDHRKINDAHLFINAKIQIELVGACATLIAEKFIKQGVEISHEAAILLYGAIVSNTLNFQSKTTTDRDKSAAQFLKTKAALSDNLAKEMFLAKSNLDGNKLKERIGVDFGQFEIANKKFGIAQIEMIGAEDLANQRQGEILAELAKFKDQLNLDFIFLSIIELKDGFNLFLTDDEPTQEILQNVFKVNFQNNQAVRIGLIMRKEIVPLLKNYFEGINQRIDQQKVGL